MRKIGCKSANLYTSSEKFDLGLAMPASNEAYHSSDAKQKAHQS
jgi:hypothetical protein